MLPFRSTQTYGRVVKSLGKGAYSTVYSTSKGFAYKISNNRYTNIPNSDIIREAASLRKIRSRYVVPLIDVLIGDKETSLVLPLAHGNLREESMKPTLRSKKVLYEACMGLAALHNGDLLHLDIKPDNFLIVPDMRTKVPRVNITDLGLSLVHTCAFPPLRTSEDLMYYTVWYRPLEACLFQALSGKSDVWALGVTLAEYLMTKYKGYREILFYSRDNEEQVHEIVSILGSPDFIQSPLLPEQKYPNIGREYLKERGLTEEELDLIVPMLELNPEKRPSIFEVLNNSYFKGMPLAPVEWDCFEKLQADEVTYPKMTYFQDLSERDVYIYYMMDMADDYQLRNESLALSVYLFDTIVEKLTPSRLRVYLYVLSCIFISDSFYESEYYFTISTVNRELKKIYGQKVDTGEIRHTVRNILEAVSFDLSPVTAYIYMSRVFTLDPELEESAVNIWRDMLLTKSNFGDQLELADSILEASPV